MLELASRWLTASLPTYKKPAPNVSSNEAHYHPQPLPNRRLSTPINRQWHSPSSPSGPKTHQTLCESSNPHSQTTTSWSISTPTPPNSWNGTKISNSSPRRSLRARHMAAVWRKSSREVLGQLITHSLPAPTIINTHIRYIRMRPVVESRSMISYGCQLEFSNFLSSFGSGKRSPSPNGITRTRLRRSSTRRRIGRRWRTGWRKW